MTILQKWDRKTILWFLVFRNWCSSILRNTFVSDIMVFFFINSKSLQSSSKSLRQLLLLLHAGVWKKAGLSASFILYCIRIMPNWKIYNSKKFKWIYTISPEDKNVYSKKYPHSYLLIEKHLRDVIKFLRLEYKLL